MQFKDDLLISVVDCPLDSIDDHTQLVCSSERTRYARYAIDLSRNNLTHINLDTVTRRLYEFVDEESIESFRNSISSLCISTNCLEEFPIIRERYGHLTEINLNQNRIESIPKLDLAYCLPELSVLSLAYNKLRIISDSDVKLPPTLRAVILCWNNLKNLPASLNGVRTYTIGNPMEA